MLYAKKSYLKSKKKLDKLDKLDKMDNLNKNLFIRPHDEFLPVRSQKMFECYLEKMLAIFSDKIVSLLFLSSS